MAVDVRVDMDQAELAELLNSADGPVGQLIQELSWRALAVAVAVVRVRTQRAGWSASAPGVTKASIRPHLAWDTTTGMIYGGVNAIAEPTIFLENPAIQIKRKGHKFPFLSTGLWSLEGQV